jgi:tRNA threonylcarbamoyl adenosine modification protein YeaZ
MTLFASRPAEDPRPGPRLYLAMETSGREGSVALGFLPENLLAEETPWSALRILGTKTLEEREEQGALLVPRVQELMEESGCRTTEIAGILVGAGPGSFTGVRVGAATAKGMARALGVPLWAFSSLACAALPASAEPGPSSTPRVSGNHGSFGLPEGETASIRPRCAIFDARGNRVYAAAYRISPKALEPLLQPRASTVDEMCDGLIPPGALLVGEGAQRHRPAFEAAGFEVLPPPSGVPSAEALLRLRALNPTARPLPDPGRWEPDYLRASGAERMRRSKGGQ